MHSFQRIGYKQTLAYVQEFISVMTLPPKESIQHQAEVSLNWKGSCNTLSSLTKPTLIITGTDDVTSPPANSLILTQKIPGAWLVQIKGGGQYPEEFSKVLLTFLDTT